MKDVKDIILNKKQTFLVGSITSIGTITIYATGINLSREFINPTAPVLVTTFISFISPIILKNSTTYVLKRFKKNKQKKLDRSKL